MVGAFYLHVFYVFFRFLCSCCCGFPWREIIFLKLIHIKIWIITLILSKYLVINGLVSLLVLLWFVYHGREGLIYTLWDQFVKLLSSSIVLIRLSLLYFFLCVLIQLHLPFLFIIYYRINKHPKSKNITFIICLRIIILWIDTSFGSALSNYVSLNSLNIRITFGSHCFL